MVNISCLNGDVPRLAYFDVFISQHIRFGRDISRVTFRERDGVVVERRTLDLQRRYRVVSFS